MATGNAPLRPRTPGVELRLARVRHGLRQADIALVLGVSQRRISALETLASVAPETADRYAAALRAITEPDAPST